MDKLQKETINLAKEFSTLNKKEHQFMDLVEEVGELATDIMYIEGFKTGRLTGKVSRDDVADSLCDILFDLYLISNQYGVDLAEEYSKMLAKLRVRVANGEFKKI